MLSDLVGWGRTLEEVDPDAVMVRRRPSRPGAGPRRDQTADRTCSARAGEMGVNEVDVTLYFCDILLDNVGIGRYQ